MKKTLRRLCAALFVLALTVSAAGAMTIGTFNIEFFNVSGDKRYVPDDLQKLAAVIRKSDADVLALQEVEGNATMRFFTTTALRGWKYVGNDTGSLQDLYFLWNPQKVTLVGSPEVYFANLSEKFNSRKFRLFDRPPLVATFKDNATGNEYRLVCVHLKSNVTLGKKDVAAAQQYNVYKRSKQIEMLNKFAATVEAKKLGPTFILGDYNDTNPQKNVKYPLLRLQDGNSYDNMSCNLDYIGYINIDRSQLGRVKETETRIERRSTRRKEHPDHDIVTVEIIE